MRLRNIPTLLLEDTTTKYEHDEEIKEATTSSYRKSVSTKVFKSISNQRECAPCFWKQKALRLPFFFNSFLIMQAQKFHKL